MSKIQNDMNIDFNTSTSVSEIKNHLVVPIINRKNKVETKADEIGNISSLETHLKVKELFLDMRYQRQPNEAKVSKIARNFNKDALGVIVCSIREDGAVAIIDGGHRVAALNLLGMQESTVDALVYFGLTLDQEAKIFTLMNEDRTKPKASNIFKAQVIANDEKAVGLDSLLKSLNLVPDNKPGHGIIRGVGTLKMIYDNAGHTHTLNALSALKKAFGDYSSTFNVDAVTALAIVFKKYENISFGKVVDGLKRFVTIDNMLNQAKAMNMGSSRPIRYSTLPFIIVNSYNHKLRTNRIEAYDMSIEDKNVWG